MKIIIAGAGAVGTHLAQLLAKESQNITLIDESEDKLSKVADNVDLMTLNVKPTSISGLKEAGARVTKKPVKDLGLPAGVTIGGLVRRGEGMHVNGMTQIQEGDSVVVFCQNMFIKKLDKYFA